MAREIGIRGFSPRGITRGSLPPWRGVAALLARAQIYEKFYGGCISVMGPPEHWKSELQEVVKEGRVIAVKWGADDSCRVVYEVRRKGLRQWAHKCL
ncbi:MAG: hypothetical protein JXA20_15990 [Spirochaetes bacterium]|nr:hypothetical protein [Spirochaetota bacterium]